MGLLMTLSDAISRCRCPVGLCLFVVAPLGSLCLALHRWFLFWFFVTLSFVFLLVVGLLASFRLQAHRWFLCVRVVSIGNECLIAFFVFFGDKALSIFSFVDNACDEG